MVPVLGSGQDISKAELAIISSNIEDITKAGNKLKNDAMKYKLKIDWSVDQNPDSNIKY